MLQKAETIYKNTGKRAANPKQSIIQLFSEQEKLNIQLEKETLEKERIQA